MKPAAYHFIITNTSVVEVLHTYWYITVFTLVSIQKVIFSKKLMNNVMDVVIKPEFYRSTVLILTCVWKKIRTLTACHIILLGAVVKHLNPLTIYMLPLFCLWFSAWFSRIYEKINNLFWLSNLRGYFFNSISFVFRWMYNPWLIRWHRLDT